MPSGSRRHARRAARARGFTWWGLLLMLAVSGAALAALGQQWSLQAQREREAELRFRGEQIRAAIGRYHAARQPAAWPPDLQALLADPRGDFEGGPRHHLRRLWTDPFTGRADWELLPAPAPATGFVGVRSRSAARRLAGAGTSPTESMPKVSDWRFEHTTAARVDAPRRTPRGGANP